MPKDCYDWPWKPMDTIPVDNGLCALLRLNPQFPLAVSHDNLSSYRNGFVNWHKQGSIEISVVTEGTVAVKLLNRQEKIKAGEGFLIFPGVLHSICGDGGGRPASYQTMFFEPCLLNGFRGSYFERHYYKPEIVNRNSFFRFSMAENPLCSCAGDVNDIFRDDYWGDAYRQTQVHHKLQKIWIALWDGVIAGQLEDTHKTEDARLLSMIEFLQKNHQKKFVLDELCRHVNFSRSACCRYFRKMMDMSITDYLTEYHLSQALVMLAGTDKSITEIALSSGFATASYFGSRFKEKMRMTPLEYRMREKEGLQADV